MSLRKVELIGQDKHGREVQVIWRDGAIWVAGEPLDQVVSSDDGLWLRSACQSVRIHPLEYDALKRIAQLNTDLDPAQRQRAIEATLYTT